MSKHHRLVDFSGERRDFGDNVEIRARCTCGWKGAMTMSQSDRARSGGSVAMLAAKFLNAEHVEPIYEEKRAARRALERAMDDLETGARLIPR